MKSTYTLIFLVLFILIGSLTALSSANAIDLTASFGSILGLSQCVLGSDGDNTFVLRNIACVRFNILAVTQEYIVEFMIFLESYIYAFITLAVTFFGIRLTMGEPEMSKKAFQLILKIAIVLWLGIEGGVGLGTPTLIGSDLVLSIFDIMGELQQFVTSIMILELATDPHCELSILTVINSFFGTVVWERLDCMLDKLLGLSGGKAFFAASVIGIVSSALFSGTMGIMVFFLGIATLLTVVIFAFRAIWIYISSYLLVGFLLVLTPLVAPFLLFGFTTNMFTKWMGAILSGIFQPVILFAFLSLALPLLDRVMFDTTYDLSIASVLGDKGNQSRVNEISESHTGKAQKCQWSIPADQDFYKNISAPDWLEGPLRNILTPMMSGQTDLCALFDFNALDLGEDHFQELMKIGYAFFVAVFTAWVLKGVMDAIPQISSAIFGTYLSFDSPLNNMLSSRMGAAQIGMKNSMKGNRGPTSFVRSMPSAIGAGIR